MEDAVEDCLRLSVVLVFKVTGQIELRAGLLVDVDRVVHSTVVSLEGDRLVNLVESVNGLPTDSEGPDGPLENSALGHDDADVLVVLVEVIWIHSDRILVDDMIWRDLQ